MRTIDVEPYSLRERYNSFEEGITGALRDPLQPKAKADSARLLGSHIVNAWWTDKDFVICFSNGLSLHIRVEGETLSWSLKETFSPFDESQGLGTPAVMLNWPNGRDHLMDRSELVTKRLGSEFERLFVTAGALLVYCRSQLIWWFSPARQTNTRQSILFVNEDD